MSRMCGWDDEVCDPMGTSGLGNSGRANPNLSSKELDCLPTETTGPRARENRVEVKLQNLLDALPSNLFGHVDWLWYLGECSRLKLLSPHGESILREARNAANQLLASAISRPKEALLTLQVLQSAAKDRRRNSWGSYPRRSWQWLRRKLDQSCAKRTPPWPLLLWGLLWYGLGRIVCLVQHKS